MSLTKIGSIGINTGIQLAGVTTVSTLHVGSGVTLSSDGDVFATGISTFSEDIKVGSGVTISPDGDGFYTGVVTATSFVGDGANLTNVDVVSDTSPQLGGNLDVNTKNIVFGDSGSSSDDRLVFGASSDLQIFCDGTHSSILNTNASGYINIDTDNFRVRDDDGSENIIRAFKDGAVELYHNNTKKFETTSSGITVTGAVNASSVTLGDDNKAYFGTSNDLAIYHDGSNSYILNTTNNLILKDLTDAVYIQAPSIIFNDETTNENIARFISDGAVELYHNNSKKIETASYGVLSAGQVRVSSSNATTVAFSVGDEGTGFYNTGSNAIGYASQGTQKWNIDSSGSLRFNDSVSARFGTGNDLLIYHDGSHSYIDNSTGSLKIRDTGGVTKISVYGSGTIFSNTTDDAAMNDCILLTRRGYEFSGYGTKIQAMGGSSDSQNGIRFAHSHSNGGGYTVRQRFDHDGIKFNGDTAAANGLDDYEEGNWTPTFATWSNISYSASRNAEYVKIGSLVYIRGFIAGSSTGSNSGQIKVGGLPFTPNAGGYGRYAISLQGSQFALGSGNAGVFGLVDEGAAQFDIYGGNASGTGINIYVSQWNGSGIYFAGCYHVLGY